jgi:hypothetical protein
MSLSDYRVDAAVAVSDNEVARELCEGKLPAPGDGRATWFKDPRKPLRARPAMS